MDSFFFLALPSTPSASFALAPPQQLTFPQMFIVGVAVELTILSGVFSMKFSLKKGSRGFTKIHKMLTRQDLRWSCKIFQIGSTLNIFPVTFDPVTGQMKSQKSGLRRFIFRIWQAVGLSHIFYIVLLTIQTGLSSETKYRDFTPLMLTMCVTFIGMFLHTNFMFLDTVEENVKVYNELLRIRGEFI